MKIVKYLVITLSVTACSDEAVNSPLFGACVDHGIQEQMFGMSDSARQSIEAGVEKSCTSLVNECAESPTSNVCKSATAKFLSPNNGLQLETSDKHHGFHRSLIIGRWQSQGKSFHLTDDLSDTLQIDSEAHFYDNGDYQLKTTMSTFLGRWSFKDNEIKITRDDIGTIRYQVIRYANGRVTLKDNTMNSYEYLNKL